MPSGTGTTGKSTYWLLSGRSSSRHHRNSSGDEIHICRPMLEQSGRRLYPMTFPKCSWMEFFVATRYVCRLCLFVRSHCWWTVHWLPWYAVPAPWRKRELSAKRFESITLECNTLAIRRSWSDPLELELLIAKLVPWMSVPPVEFRISWWSAGKASW